MSEPDGFLDLVRRMRAAQIEYFKTRDQTTLRDCKQLERQVDAAVARKDHPELFPS